MPEENVFVVDDDSGVRKAIEFVVKSAGLNAKSYPSADAFLNACGSDPSGCLVLDVRMPGMSGLELQEELAARGTEIPIVFVTGHGDVPMCTRALTNGAIDFIEKPFDDERLLQSIRRAIALDAGLRGERARRKELTARLELLTTRQRQVLRLLVAGRHTKQIAAELGISIKTVDKHRTSVLERMRADNVVELVQLLALAGDTVDQPPGYPSPEG